MNSLAQDLVYFVPIYKEQGQVNEFLNKIMAGPYQQVKAIIFAENGSSQSADEVTKLKSQFPALNIFYTSTPLKGFGAGIKAAWQFLKNKGQELNSINVVVITSIDLPFLYSDLDSVKKINNSVDFAVGSKLHPESKIERSWKRSMATRIYFVIRKILFKTQIHDPQGTFFIKKDTFEKVIKKVSSNDFFFTTEFTLWSEKLNFSGVEVPVTFIDCKDRTSKVSLINDSLKMFFQLILLKKRMLFEK